MKLHMQSILTNIHLPQEFKKSKSVDRNLLLIKVKFGVVLVHQRLQYRLKNDSIFFCTKLFVCFQQQAQTPSTLHITSLKNRYNYCTTVSPSVPNSYSRLTYQVADITHMFTRHPHKYEKLYEEKKAIHNSAITSILNYCNDYFDATHD